MLLRLVVAALFLLLPPAVQAADAPTCGDLPCRASGRPYVTADGAVVILPGETFSAEPKFEGEEIVALVPRAGKDAPNAVMLELTVMNGMTALVWGNHLGRPVRLVATSIGPKNEVTQLDCLLPPGLYTYQVWKFVVEAVEVRDLMFTPVAGAKCD